MHLNIPKLKARTEQIAHCQNDEFYEKWWLLLCHIAHQYESGTILDLEAGLLSFTFPLNIPMNKKHIFPSIKVDFQKSEVAFYDYCKTRKIKWKVHDRISQKYFLFNNDSIFLPDDTVYLFENEEDV